MSSSSSSSSSSSNRAASNAPLVWVLCGGTSTEHEVSLVSGRQVFMALAGGRYRARPVVILRDGTWRVGRMTAGPRVAQQDAAKLMDSVARSSRPGIVCERALSLMRRDAPYCVFIALHGPGGEDGSLQALLEWIGVPYTGSGPSASALAMDKVRCQAFFERMGFRVAPSVSSLDLAARDRAEATRHAAALARLATRRLSLPVFVKPGFGGSSLGMTRVGKRGELASAGGTALKAAPQNRPEVLVEQAIPGRELTCGVLEMPDREGDARPQALPVTEIRPVGHDYFDYEAKYVAGACEELTPAPIPAATAKRVRAAAVRAHMLLGCRWMSRADFILRDDGELFILEVNTIPGMTPTSLLPQGAAAFGVSFGEMCELLVQRARG